MGGLSGAAVRPGSPKRVVSGHRTLNEQRLDTSPSTESDLEIGVHRNVRVVSGEATRCHQVPGFLSVLVVWIPDIPNSRPSIVYGAEILTPGT